MEAPTKKEIYFTAEIDVQRDNELKRNLDLAARKLGLVQRKLKHRGQDSTLMARVINELVGNASRVEFLGGKVVQDGVKTAGYRFTVMSDAPTSLLDSVAGLKAAVPAGRAGAVTRVTYDCHLA